MLESRDVEQEWKRNIEANWRVYVYIWSQMIQTKLEEL